MYILEKAKRETLVSIIPKTCANLIKVWKTTTTSIDRYFDTLTFIVVLTTIGLGIPERNMIRLEWFNNIQDIADTYKNIEDLKKLMINLNKTFSSAARNPIYFPITATWKLLGVHHMYHLRVNIITIVSDPVLITSQDALSFAETYEL